MNNNNYLKYFRIFIAIALVVSLIMNFNLFSRLDRVEHQLDSLSHNQHNILSDVNSQGSHVQNIMNEFLAEQSWISRINMEFDQKDAEGAATFEWQVKELQSNSEVTFNYVYGPGEDFITLPAKEIQQGFFQVKIPIKVEVEPLWEVGVITITDSSMEEESKQKFEERMDERDQQHRLKYFVSVKYDDMVKSSEIHTEHLGHFGTSKYGMIRSDIHIHQNNISLTLYNEFMMEPSDHVVKAYLVKYKGDKLIEEEEMESLGPEEEWPRHFHVNQIEKYENMRLVIKVEYSNGEIFEKEVLMD